MRWSPEQLADVVGGRLLKRSDRAIAEAFIDSRDPVDGGLFVPIVAARDGHDFIADALEGGGAATLQHPGTVVPAADATVVEVDDTLAAFTALASDARARISGPVVAITGSNGKTTTRSMVAAALDATLGNVLRTGGNLNNHLGVPLTLCGTPHDPDAAVIEIGMNAPGEVDRLARVVQPTAAVITGVALEHVEFLGSLEAIARAESEVMQHVFPGGALVIPSDEGLLSDLVPASYRPRVLTFGPDPDADVRILDVRVGLRTIATLAPRGGPPMDVALRPFGAHNARNAAAAVGIGLYLGLPLARVAEALEEVEPVGDRGRVVGMGDHLVIADCYNANPGSMEAALRSLAALRATGVAPLAAVLGDMLELGPDERRMHAQVGELAAELGIDRVIGIGPRSEDTVASAREAGVEASHVGEDVSAAADAVVKALGDGGGAVLIKASRGARLERLVDVLAGRL